MDGNEFLKSFSVAIYGDTKKYNDVLSIGRCRIFYKGANRNASYITDEFAEKLIRTLPYTPVKGIYDGEDYGKHDKPTDGRIYGIVPDESKMDIAWETHLDDDGVLREYICCNVFLFTAIYDEAEEIIGKSQSMELYPPSIKGHFEIISGMKYFVFEEGCFMGLQVLGDAVEPCFEGAAFFELYDSLMEVIKKIENYQINEGGQTDMPTLNFKLSDGQKHSLLFSALNPNFTEEGNWTIDCAICEIYDDYALVWNYETNDYSRAYYTKNEDDTVTVGEVVKAFIVDVTESEYNTLKAVQAINGGTYENMQEVVEKGLKADEQISEYEQKLAENEDTISTLTSERDSFSGQVAEAQGQVEELNGTVEELNGTVEELNSTIEGLNTTIEGLNTEVEELNTFKTNVETEKKSAIVDKYSLRLDEEKIAEFREKLGEFTITDLEKELALALVDNDPSIFSVQGQNNGFVPKADQYEEGSLEALLSKYKKN